MTPLKHTRFVRSALRISALVTLAGLIAFGCRYVGYSEHVPTVKHGWDRKPTDLAVTQDGVVLALEYADGFLYNRVNAYRNDRFVATLELPRSGYPYYRRITASPEPGVFWVMGTSWSRSQEYFVHALRYRIDGASFRHLSTHTFDVPGRPVDFAVAAGTGVYQHGLYVLSQEFQDGRGIAYITHDTLPCSGGGGCLRSSLTKRVLPDTGEPILEAGSIAVDAQTGDVHLSVYNEFEDRRQLYCFARGDLSRGVRGPLLEDGTNVIDLAARGGLVTLVGRFGPEAPRSVRSYLFAGRGYSDVLSEAVDGQGGLGIVAVGGHPHENPTGCEKNGAYIYTYGEHSSNGDRFHRFGRHSFCFTGSSER